MKTRGKLDDFLDGRRIRFEAHTNNALEHPSLADPRIVEGPATITVPAPLEEIPLFVRRGATIPMLPPDVWSLASHDATAATVRPEIPSS